MTVPLFIIGAGGFGREVLSIVRAIAESGGTKYSAVFIDDRPTESNLALVDELGATLGGNVNDLAMRDIETRAVIAIGDASARQQVAERLRHSPIIWPTLIHPAASQQCRSFFSRDRPLLRFLSCWTDPVVWCAIWA